MHSKHQVTTTDVGNLFLVIYAVVDFIGQVSIVIISIDAPLRMLLESSDEQYIPKNYQLKIVMMFTLTD